MKHILIGDTHFDVSNGSEEVFNNQLKVFNNQILPLMEERNIKSIVQTGDITDNRTKLSLNIQHRLKTELFDILELKNINLISIIGNHDIYKKTDLSIYSMEVFEKAYKNLTIISKPTKLNNLLLIPWLCTQEDELNMFKEIEAQKPKGVIGHFEISDFFVSRTLKAEHGLTKDLFKNIKVFSGHYHLKQEDDNINYIGTPYQLTWSDFGENKGFYILDDETLELEFIPNESSIIHKKIVINSETKTISVDNGFEDIIESSVAKFDYDSLCNSKVKIFIDKDNAYNKKVIEAILEKVITYRIEIQDKVEEETVVEEETIKEYSIQDAIAQKVTTSFQKSVYDKVLEQSIKDLKE